MARKKSAIRDKASRKMLEAKQPDREPSITKAEAIRKAIAAGHDQPAAGIAYIKDRFDLDVSPTHFSAAKSQEKVKGAVKKVDMTAAKPGRKPAAEDDLIGAIEAIKPLVNSLGVERVKRLADLLG